MKSKEKKMEKNFKYTLQVHNSFAGISHGTNSVILSFLHVFTVKVNNYVTRGFASIWYVIKNLYIMTNSVNNASIYSYEI